MLSQMDDVQDMLMNGGPYEYDFDRLGELSRELAIKWMNAINEKAVIVAKIEEGYGKTALDCLEANLKEALD